MPAAVFGEGAPGGKNYFKYLRLPEDGGATSAEKEALTFKLLRPARTWIAVPESASPLPAWLTQRYTRTPHALTQSKGVTMVTYRSKTVHIPPRYATARLDPANAALSHLDAPSLLSSTDAWVLVKLNGLGVKGPNYVVILEEVPLPELSVAECKAVLRVGRPEEEKDGPTDALLPVSI